MGLAYKPDIDIKKLKEDGVFDAVAFGVVNQIKTQEGYITNGKIRNMFNKVWNIVDFKLSFNKLEFTCESEKELSLDFVFPLNKNGFFRGTCCAKGGKNLECISIVRDVP